MLNEVAIKNMNFDLILNEIEIDNENCDFDSVTEYELILVVLKRIFGNCEAVLEIEEALDELKENAECCRTFDKVKVETLENIGDEDLSEDVAWELAYR